MITRGRGDLWTDTELSKSYECRCGGDVDCGICHGDIDCEVPPELYAELMATR